MSVHIAKCCRHKRSQKVITYNRVSLYKCPGCKLIFRKPTKADLNPQALYNNYYRNESSLGRFKFNIEFIVKCFRFFRAFKLFTIYPKAKSVLDVGSGRGFMLYFLKKIYRYKRTAGTQIENNSYLFSKNTLKLEI
jgi:hypothetical protein